MKIKCSISIMFMLLICIVGIANAQDEVTFDGYWWGTATLEQKLGYVQGFIDGAGGSAKIFLGILLEAYAQSQNISKSDRNLIQYKFNQWTPFDKRFIYYVERIEGFYKTTLQMRTPVGKIMLDLMSPLPN